VSEPLLQAGEGAAAAAGMAPLPEPVAAALWAAQQWQQVQRTLAGAAEQEAAVASDAGPAPAAARSLLHAANVLAAVLLWLSREPRASGPRRLPCAALCAATEAGGPDRRVIWAQRLGAVRVGLELAHPHHEVHLSLIRRWARLLLGLLLHELAGWPWRRRRRRCRAA
jgi:hypothetical protein